MEKDYFESLMLEEINKEDIELIKKYKLIYSIIKYEQQSEKFKEENREKYMKALNLNNEDITEDIFPDVINALDNLKETVDNIREKNQRMIDYLVEGIIMNLAEAFDKNDSDLIACARIAQYVTKNIEYSEDLTNYETVIPFAQDYQFKCYNEIPQGKELEDILVTKDATNFQIAALMTFLGKVFDVKIKTVPAIKNNEIYFINSFESNDQISYLDPTSVIITKDVSNNLLVTKTQLKENGVILSDENVEGIKMDLDIKHASNVDKAISRERNRLIEKAKYYKESIEKEKEAKI